MFKLWIIDSAENTYKYSEFLGQFAVSFYASMDSASKIKKMVGANQPDAVLVSKAEDLVFSQECFNSSLIIYAGQIEERQD